MKTSLIIVLAALTTIACAQERPTEKITDSDGNEITIPLRDNSEARVSPNARIDQTIGTTRVHIRYGRPFVKDRTVFGDLVPYDKIWRLGANEATTISFFDDVQFGDNTIEAGTYALFAVPGENSWDFILNSEAAQWGAFRRDPEKDIAKVTVTPSSTDHTEMLTILFNNVTASSADLVARWSTTEAAVTIQTVN